MGSKDLGSSNILTPIVFSASPRLEGEKALDGNLLHNMDETNRLMFPGPGGLLPLVFKLVPQRLVHHRCLLLLISTTTYFMWYYHWGFASMFTSPSTCPSSAGPSRPASVLPSFRASLRNSVSVAVSRQENANGLVRDYDRLRPTLGEIVRTIYSRSVDDIRLSRPSSLLSVPCQRLNMLHDVTSPSSLLPIGPLFSLPRLPSLTRSSSIDHNPHGWHSQA